MLLRAILTLGLALTLTLPAQAALTLGVAADGGNAGRAEIEARQLASRLQGVLEEEVRLRVLRNETELKEWLQRYRMVDLALVSERFYRNQPAGSLLPLTKPSPGQAELTVARPGLRPETLARLTSALAALKSASPALQPERSSASSAKSARPAKPTASPVVRRPRNLSPPGDVPLQPGQEILAAPGAAPRLIASPTKKSRRTKSTTVKSIRQKPAAQVKSTLEPHPTRSVGKPVTSSAASASAAVPKGGPAASLVLPPPQPAPAQPGTTSASTAAPTIPTTQTPPAQGTVQESPTAPIPAAQPSVTPEVPAAPEPITASPIPWVGILVLVGGAAYLIQRRRQKARAIDWTAVQHKLPRPRPAVSPPSREPRPAPAPATKSGEHLASRPFPASRVPLPPTRRAAVQEEALQQEAARPAVVTVAETSPQTEKIAGSPAAADQPVAAAPSFSPDDYRLDELASDLEIPEPELDLELPSLEDFQAIPLEMENPPPAAEVPSEQEPVTEPASETVPIAPKKPARNLSDSPPLRGDIATVNIPRLLQAASAQPGPCILHIRGRHDEKRLHFRMGHMAEAISVNRANRAKTGFLMNKVGYLLIRQGRINEEQRDQALRLCEERPQLRIGEALVELDALSRESLMEALRTQAEGVIFSLFIFPEGRYEIVADDADISGANDLEIDIDALLRKAESQEVEWQRIRQAIPSLDTVLDFPEGGRDKLDSARMTDHQKLVLSLINGQRPIRDICIAATMLDLEVYKFLFFMVNAKILTRAAAA